MNDEWALEAKRILFTYAVPFAGKVVGAIVLWIVGRILIGAVQRLAERGLERRHLDATLARYARSVIGVTLTGLLLLAILSLFGVETTSFAGVIAAAGVAVGMAWSGLLSNFAAGIFMVVLRPFKVGDVITAAGVTGTVAEIGLFATLVDSPDNIRNFIGNAKIFSEVIQNYTMNPYRRLEIKVQVAHGVDPMDAIARLKARLAQIPDIMKAPATAIEIMDFNAMGPVLAVHLFCHNNHGGAVQAAANAAIHAEFTAAGYPVPHAAVGTPIAPYQGGPARSGA